MEFSCCVAQSIADGYKVNWDKSADPFALGITLYELACKAYPWNGSIKMPLLEKQPVHPQEINSSLSKDFADFLYSINAAKPVCKRVAGL